MARRIAVMGGFVRLAVKRVAAVVGGTYSFEDGTDFSFEDGTTFDFD